MLVVAGDLLQRVEASARDKLARAFAPRSRGVLASALKAFARFAMATPGRTLFHTPATMAGAHEFEVRAWNEWTLLLFATHMTMVVSRKTGKDVKSDTISSYVSMVKGFFSFIYAFTLVADKTPRLTRLIKCIHDEDPLHGIRRKRRALRRRHLRRAWKQSAALRADHPDAVNRWAAIVTGWHALARGGELCGGAKRGKARVCPPSRADLSFGRTTRGVRFACLMLRPLKLR